LGIPSAASATIRACFASPDRHARSHARSASRLRVSLAQGKITGELHLLHE
jgi:hypothetical protein